jgi:PAS domain S-box-containing protein
MTHRDGEPRLRILLVDDNPDDRALAERSLRETFPSSDVRHIYTPAGLDDALRGGDFDLVVTDYHLRWSDGREVLRRVKERSPDCPVILYTGTGSEEIAVEVMKAGLDEYVLKSSKHLIRLGAAAQAALERAEQRRMLREAEQRYQSLFESSLTATILIDPAEGRIVDANPAACSLYGLSRESLTQMRTTDLQVDAATGASSYSSTGTRDRVRHRIAGGEIREVEVYSGPLRVRGEDLLYWLVHDVTDQVRAQEALRESQARFRRYFELGLIGMAITSPTRGILEVNDQICTILGYERDEMLQKTWPELTHPDDREADESQFARVVAGEIDGYSLDKRWIRKDGGVVHSSISVKAVRRPDDSIDYFVALLQDTTERKRAARLQEASFRITAAANEAPSLEDFLVAVHREVGQVLEATNLYVAVCDERRTTLTFAYYADQNLPQEERTVPVSRPFGSGLSEYTIRQARSVLLRRPEIERLESTGQAAPLGTMPQVWLGVPLRNKDTIVGLIALQHYTDPSAYSREDVGFLEFVSDQIGVAIARRQAEEGLRESEDRFRRLAENAPDLIYRYRLLPEPRFEYVSPAAAAITGYSPEDHYADPDLGRKLVHPDDRVLLEETTRDPGGPAGPVILRWIRRDGRVIWTEQQNVAIRDEKGRLVAIEGIARDVTPRMQRERELGGVVRVAAALRHAPTREAMKPVIVGQLTDLLGAEGAALAMVDGSTGEAIVELAQGRWAAAGGLRIAPGTGIMGRVMATGAPYLSDNIRADPFVVQPGLISATRTAAFVPLVVQDQVIGALGLGRDIEFSQEDIRLLTAIADMAGNALHRAGVMETLEHRVAERTRALEEANTRLLELDRLKSEFVSNVSHELRTPITNILLYLDLLAQPSRADRVGAYVGILRNEAHRLGKLIEDLLTLSRIERSMHPPDLEPYSLDPLVAEVLAAHLVRAAAKGIEVVQDLDPSLSVVRVSRDQMSQVFTNLVSNAIAYTPTGGQIHVASEAGQIGERRYAVVRVHNSGAPIDPADMPHLFERFYRGKNGRESGEPGTGLGLAITKEIVERHEGWVDVDSREGHGTTFSVWLPVVSDSSASP